MPRKAKPLTFDQIVTNLRSHQFDVREVPGAAGRLRVEKNGVAAFLAR
jgi:hypothetical protein